MLRSGLDRWRNIPLICRRERGDSCGGRAQLGRRNAGLWHYLWAGRLIGDLELWLARGQRPLGWV